MDPHMADFISGLIAMNFIVGAAFFLKFWTKTKDELFFAFALAFLLLAVSQGLTTMLRQPLEERSGIFLLRLAAFVLLIVAILRKNVRG